MKIISVAILICLITGCSSTKVVGFKELCQAAGCTSTKVVGYKGQGYTKKVSSVAVVSIASDLETRDLVEEKLVNSFSKSDVRALKTVQLMPFLNQLKSDEENPELSKKLKDIMQGVDAVLLLQLENTIGGIPYEWKIILQNAHGEIWSGKSKTSNAERLNGALNSFSEEFVAKLKADGII